MLIYYKMVYNYRGLKLTKYNNMRKLLLLFALICTMQLHGQTVKEWMGLPPAPVEFPAFGNTRNVENKTFSQADLLTLSTFNIDNLTPAV